MKPIRAIWMKRPPLDTAVESQEHRILSVKLFGLLVGWLQECPAATKIARKIQNQSGFELWRFLWKEFHPEQANRGLIWKQKPDMEKGLAEPKVPLQRVGIQRSVAGRELDLAKYASETGDARPSESQQRSNST